MRYKEHGIVIEPNEIQFSHVLQNNAYRQIIHVKNVGNKSKRIQIFRPAIKDFQLVVNNPDEPVPPGLEVTGVVEYIARSNQEQRDTIVVDIDGQEIQIPLLAFPARPEIFVDELVDFGVHVADNKTVYKKILVRNIGSTPAPYRIEYKGEHPIGITPLSAMVPPNSSIPVEVSLLTSSITDINDIATLDACHRTHTIKLIGKIMNRRLCLLHPKSDEELQKLNFGSCYYGCDLTALAILYNDSPESVAYSALIDDSKPSDSDKTGTSDVEYTLNPLNSIITVFPNQGILNPFEKRALFFRFSPRAYPPKQAFAATLDLPPKRDIAAFMYFELLGASPGLSNIEHSKTKLEIAVAGTALPVILSLEPQALQYPTTYIGQKEDKYIHIYNQSDHKSIDFRFPSIANFAIQPASGKLKPREKLQVLVTLIPHQIGNINKTLVCEVLGAVVNPNTPVYTQSKPIHQAQCLLTGYSSAITEIPIEKFNMGLKPMISNEVGANVITTHDSLKRFHPRAAVLNSANDTSHNTRASNSYFNNFKKHKVSFPNDRARSIAPFNRDDSFITPFTKEQRYNYVDPDYAYTDEERKQIEMHDNMYNQLFDEQRFQRSEVKRTKEHKKYDNDIDLGIKPANGLESPHITLADVEKNVNKAIIPSYPNWKYRLPTTSELAEQEQALLSKPIKEGLNSVPTTQKEKNDCAILLSPSQLFKIVVGPPELNFGEVCVNAPVTKFLSVLNNLDQFILVQIDVDSSALKMTSPLSQVIPGKSHVQFSVTFEPTEIGLYQRSLSYIINNFYRHYVKIIADVRVPTVQLSTEKLLIRSLPHLLAEDSFRKVVHLYNPLNAPAEFRWIPIVGPRGTAFSIRPATGIIEPYQTIDSEVVWYGSTQAPLENYFTLYIFSTNDSRKVAMNNNSLVPNSETALTLQCIAQVGKAKFKIPEKRVNFGLIPINMITKKSFTIVNEGTNHLFYQITDPNPCSGVIISPANGLVSAGSQTSITIEVTPIELIKFDIKFGLKVLGQREQEIRMTGDVVEPTLNIPETEFNFGGVPILMKAMQPFCIENKGTVKGIVEINLSKYPDFSIKTNPVIGNEQCCVKNGQVYSITVQPDETIEAELVLIPAEIAFYDFLLPIRTCPPLLNVEGLSQASKPESASHHHRELSASEQKALQPSHPPINRRIRATALSDCLQLSTKELHFQMYSTQYSAMKQGAYCDCKEIILINNSKKQIHWQLDLRDNVALDDDIFRVLHSSLVPFISPSTNIGPEGEIEPKQMFSFKINFAPKKPGIYKTRIPFYTNHNQETPYTYIELTGELIMPNLIFEPRRLILPPVPLDIDSIGTVRIRTKGFEKNTKLIILSHVKPIDVSYEFHASFREPAIINIDKQQDFLMKICFSSNHSYSEQIIVKIIDEERNCFEYEVYVTADNSIFTCYSFLWKSENDYQIVVQPGQIMKGSRIRSDESNSSGEPLLVQKRTVTSSNSRPNTSTSATFDQVDHTSDGTSTDENISAQNRNERSPTPYARIRSGSSNTFNHTTTFSQELNAVSIPYLDNDSKTFQWLVSTLERWYSNQGWPKGTHVAKVPQSFRNALFKRLFETVGTKQNAKEEQKTIYDMITHLSGHSLPGIPQNSVPPKKMDEATKQYLWQHRLLLLFLKTQGSCTAFIRPEYLLPFDLYNVYIQMRETALSATISNEQKDNEFAQEHTKPLHLSQEVFETVSKKTWVDVLMQTIKSLVLGRITPKSYEQLGIPDRNKLMPDINTDPTSSNIYGISERILLTWLNYCYSNYREQVWSDREQSSIPSGRWIVNFDIDLVDSIVLGTVLGAYCPFLIESHLQRMYVHPTTGEQYLQNALIIVSCLLQIGVEYDLQALDITRADPICMCLLVCYLYEHLPDYLSKGRIQFGGVLHEPSTSQVKITNPSTQTLVYSMNIVGRDADEFQLVKGTTLSIPAKTSLLVNIQSKNKRLRPTEAVLLLYGKRTSTYPGSAMVFYLQSSIQTITPKKTHRIEAPLYKITKSTIEITNPFDQHGMFQVAIVNSSESTQEMRNPLVALNDENKNDSVEELFQILKKNKKRSNQNNEADCFFIEHTSIELKAHETKNFDVQYIATTAKRREALLVFMNETIGEFLFLIEGVPKKPEAFPVSSDKAMKIDQKKIKAEKLRFKAVVGISNVFDIDIPVQNSQRQTALVAVRWQGMSERERQKQTLLGLTNQLPDSSKKPSHPYSRLPEFKVQSSSTTNNFIIPTSLSLPLEELLVKLPIRFQADKPGIYSTKVSLTCGDDIRDFDIEIHCITQTDSEKQTATLQMRTSVFTPVQQNIPIANSTEDDWNMTVIFSGNKSFSGPKTFRVEAKSVYQYPLTFHPQVEDDKFHAQMVISNADTGFTQAYNLRGKSDRGPPIGHLQLESKVGTTTTHSIDISNKKSKKTAYFVTCNLPFVQGPPYVCVPPKKSARYNFEICPPKRGTYKGVVVFQPGPWPIKDVDSDGDEIPPLEPEDPTDFKYSLWFTVEINVQPPDAQKTVDLSAPCLGTNSLIIPLRNPLDHPIRLDVDFQTLHDVFGNDSIEFEANGEGRYELIFKPKTIGNWNGGLVFYNDDIGEFWYELNLLSTNPQRVDLPSMSAPLGGTSTQEITIENPLDEQVTFQTVISNNNNFSINGDQDTVTVQPRSQAKINVIFNPSSIGNGNEQKQQSKISFLNDKLGTLKYAVKGVGTKPQKQQHPIILKSETGVSSTATIDFQNPSNHPIRCDLSLTSGFNTSFRILLDKTENVSIGAREKFNIPIAFCPETLSRQETQLRIIGRLPEGKTWSPDNADASELSWTYPLQGIGFNWIHQRGEDENQLKVIECVAGERIEQQLEFELNRQLFRFDSRTLNMKKSPTAIEDYTVMNEHMSNQEFIQNSVGIQLLKRDNDKTDIARFNIVYTPSKFITMDCVLVLTLATGGQLKYPLRFVKLEAPPDDDIVLEAVGLNKISTIGFRLYSPSDSPISFEAYFTSNSDRAFAVTPDSGELLPASLNGTLLKVSFCPTVYGRTSHGMLIINVCRNVDFSF
ncbi:unnamed protein product [Rotaria magnacalcarata]|uniref:Calponin-homology (CH) domain-containing protein n=3 Tax=Rotaria magnacalcarata TaxID=392030 RepID=A0A816ZJ33_9BILA|nr:unnamed protein product [Rotaria magnacalcarata]CAF2241514.1 unnamed protein product [Rotaria magnacalcarata]CAF3762004.1 unnamed protein product [Rotaria magnacalcarata]CAF3804685.1 unnamed protein product [Rotaria magnacalcarata]